MRRAIPLLLALLVAAATVALAGREPANAQDRGSATTISVGDSHACALLRSGEIECWGGNDYGQADAPAGRFIAVSAGGEHTCAVRETGALACWGSDFAGRTDAPEGRFSTVSISPFYNCAVHETSELACWGSDYPGRVEPPTSRHFRAVSAGEEYACGLRESSEIECWGYTFDGQARPPAGPHRALSAGAHHACAVSVGGTVSCWMIYNAAADVPARLRQPSAEPAVAAVAGRIVARRSADGRVEFAWLPTGAAEPVLPQRRYFPTAAPIDRWLRSSPVEVDGVEIGRITARLRADGRIEACFRTSSRAACSQSGYVTDDREWRSVGSAR